MKIVEEKSDTIPTIILSDFTNILLSL